MKHIAKHIFVLILGLLLVGFGIVHMLNQEDDEMLHMGESHDNSSFIYLLIGVIMTSLGIMGIIKDQRKNPRRRY